MDDAIKQQILAIMAAHRIMTVATLRPDGWPQATTVGYAHEGLTLHFLCGPDSQKANNLAGDARVSITIDHDEPQVMKITGLSMSARAARSALSPTRRDARRIAAGVRRCDLQGQSDNDFGARLFQGLWPRRADGPLTSQLAGFS